MFNSNRERQSQIEELTKELKKTQEEYEAIKYKLKGYKNKHGVNINRFSGNNSYALIIIFKKKHQDSCENCEEMLSKLTEKTKSVQEKEQLISELISVMNKFKSQLNIQDDILKLTSNKLFTEAMLKINSSQSKSNNSIGNVQSNTMVKMKK